MSDFALLPVRLLSAKTWTSAFRVAWHETTEDAIEQLDESYNLTWVELVRDASVKDRAVEAFRLADHLFEVRHPVLALAWLMLATEAGDGDSVFRWLPQVSWMVDKHISDKKLRPIAGLRLRATVGAWRDIAVGGWRRVISDPFAEVNEVIAARKDVVVAVHDGLERAREAPTPQAAVQAGVIVMPKETSTEPTYNKKVFKELLGATVPLTIARDVSGIRDVLRGEYPHAVDAIDLLLRDLRDGEAVRMKPIMLLGTPGSGKSRLVRRLVSLLDAKIYRFDAASAMDSMFGGTPKSWGGAEASIPARAIQQTKVANPFLMVDEIDHAATGHYHGNFWNAIVPFLERETASEYRDVALDSVLDLSWITYVATANDDTKLPAPLRDRLRIVRVPAPEVQHLAGLSTSILKQMAAEDEVDPGFLPPLDGDELAVIEKAWRSGEPSVRRLQKMVKATIDARAQFARRH